MVFEGRIAQDNNFEQRGQHPIIDAAGCLVTPGLIDYHTHIYDTGSQTGINPYMCLIPNGITTAVDAGSAGLANIKGFASQMASYPSGWYAFLNMSPSGLISTTSHESIQPDLWKTSDYKEYFERWPDNLCGLKLRLSAGVVREQGWTALEKALEIASDLDTRLCVHVTDTQMDQSRIIEKLRSGDIYCHMYQGYGKTILDDGAPKAALKAKKRGVIFDACHGKSNFSNVVAKKAMGFGLLPNVISSDVSAVSYLRPEIECGLPYVMSKFLALGIPLHDVVSLATAAPANLLGQKGKIGTIAEGAPANITILKIKTEETTFADSRNDQIIGKEILVPMATIINGVLVWADCSLKRRMS
jgi:predicted amidohydrolase